MLRESMGDKATKPIIAPTTASSIRCPTRTGQPGVTNLIVITRVAALLVQTDFEMRMRRLCDAAKVSPGDVGLEANPAAKLKQEPTRETVRFSTAYK